MAKHECGHYFATNRKCYTGECAHIKGPLNNYYQGHCEHCLNKCDCRASEGWLSS